ncbi:MAG TPA: trypsin-like peptidase domain-containing protein [Ilumatobacteraceae bacterium]|nr:trypsin-like peptidase domain-containing protein [Ilumatobacteraceae bacterium]
MTLIIRLIAATTTLLPAGAATANNAAVTDPSRPHVLIDEVAELIVRIRGGDVCSGTPITATPYVVTAAHCVLDADGTVASSRTVLRDGVTYTPLSVLVAPGYQEAPGPSVDVAVLVMDRVIPGPSALLGESVPAHGTLTLAGYQPLDTDGSLLRGARYGDRPLPQGAGTGVVTIETAPAGCVNLATAARTHDTSVSFPCGLIPGASGGGLFANHDGHLVLVGITSTVSLDLTTNGLAPMAAVHELLAHPDSYRHDMTATASSSPTQIVRS